MNKKEILEEAVQILKSPVTGREGFSKGSGMAIASLAIAVGDLEKVASETGKKIDKLNREIKKYSISSDKYARAMKWLTVGIFFISAVVGTFEVINLLYHIGIL